MTTEGDIINGIAEHLAKWQGRPQHDKVDEVLAEDILDYVQSYCHLQARDFDLR